MMSEPVDLYDNVYADFGSRAEAAVRRQAFGADLLISNESAVLFEFAVADDLQHAPRGARARIEEGAAR
jgi:hypothetical protein